MENTRLEIGYAPRLVTVDEAAQLLGVSSSTIRNWISEDRIPYVELPGSKVRRRWRIPLDGLISSLAGNYDLAGAMRRAEERARAAGISADELTELVIRSGDSSNDKSAGSEK